MDKVLATIDKTEEVRSPFDKTDDVPVIEEARLAAFQPKGPQVMVYTPPELLQHIVSFLDLDGIKNFRLTNRRINENCDWEFGKYVAANPKLYPIRASTEAWLSLVQRPVIATRIDHLYIYNHTIKVRDMGYQLGWDYVTTKLDVNITHSDMYHIAIINAAHQIAASDAIDYTCSGLFGYKLKVIFAKLPALKAISIIPVEEGGHIPGWLPEDHMRALSFYTEPMPCRQLFYNDYQWDLLYRRVTRSTDEYGVEETVDDLTDEQVGPQITLVIDVNIAVAHSAPHVNVTVFTEDE